MRPLANQAEKLSDLQRGGGGTVGTVCSRILGAVQKQEQEEARGDEKQQQQRELPGPRRRLFEELGIGLTRYDPEEKERRRS